MQLILGDFREVSDKIPDNSIDQYYEPYPGKLRIVKKYSKYIDDHSKLPEQTTNKVELIQGDVV